MRSVYYRVYYRPKFWCARFAGRQASRVVPTSFTTADRRRLTTFIHLLIMPLFDVRPTSGVGKRVLFQSHNKSIKTETS